MKKGNINVRYISVVIVGTDDFKLKFGQGKNVLACIKMDTTDLLVLHQELHQVLDSVYSLAP